MELRSPPDRGSSLFQPDKCIICQKSKGHTLTSTTNGRRRIIETSAVRKDVVLERLNSVENEFVHTLFFYKKPVCKKLGLRQVKN